MPSTVSESEEKSKLEDELEQINKKLSQICKTSVQMHNYGLMRAKWMLSKIIRRDNYRRSIS